MNLSDLEEQFDRLAQKLSNGCTNWSELSTKAKHPANRFRELDHSTEAELESAVQQYAQTRKWPKMTESTQAMLVCRLEFAASLASDIRVLKSALKMRVSWQADPQEWFVWFLLRAWDDIGYPQIYSILESLPPSDTLDTSRQSPCARN